MWNKQTKLVAFDRLGVLLPNGAERSPDAAWVKKERWNAPHPRATPEVSPLSPDFVVELCSQ